jgi:hypothetical protein
MRLFLASTAFVFFSAIYVSFFWYHHNNLWYGGLKIPREQPASAASFLSPEAYPVYGIRADFHWKMNEKEKNNQTMTAVYAIPSDSSEPLLRRRNIKGIVVLLHACTHNALKFFAPSSTCPDCIGLSEEMRLARIVLERGYVVVAVTASSKGGCWGGDNDEVEGIRTVLGGFRGHWRQLHNNNNNPHGSSTTSSILDMIDDPPTVYAIGASSGGFMAAKLVAEGVAESAAVMVMGLRNQLLDKISSLPEDPGRKLYFAPMTRDKGTTKKVRENYAHWMGGKQQEGGRQRSSTKNAHEMLVDEVSCVPLPVTADYLWNRVPGMTLEAARIIVRILLDHNHLDPSTLKLVVDPTRSNWRDFFLQGDLPVPNTLFSSEHQQQQWEDNNNNNNNNNNNFRNNKSSSMVLWGKFDLTPGISPLAKALHRAWAMHEYCSEIVEHALDLFEGQKTKQEILECIQQQQKQQQQQQHVQE